MGFWLNLGLEPKGRNMRDSYPRTAGLTSCVLVGDGVQHPSQRPERSDSTVAMTKPQENRLLTVGIQ